MKKMKDVTMVLTKNRFSVTSHHCMRQRSIIKYRPRDGMQEKNKERIRREANTPSNKQHQDKENNSRNMLEEGKRVSS